MGTFVFTFRGDRLRLDAHTMGFLEHPADVAVAVVLASFAAARQLYRVRWERAETREREVLARLRIEHAERSGELGCLDVQPRRSTSAALLGAVLRRRA
jgi:hypothetical protein